MRILVVYPYIPYPLDRGTYHRTYHLLEELAKRHDVTLLALAERGQGMEYRKVFEGFCRRVEFIEFEHPAWSKLFGGRLTNPLPPNVAHWTIPSVAAAIARLAAGEAFDAVHVCDIVMAQYFQRLAIPLMIDRSRVDLQFQLAEHRRMKFPFRTRLLRWEGYCKLWLYERELAARATEIVCGEDDAAFVHRWIWKRAAVEVVPNGVDTDFFFPGHVVEPLECDPTVLFCGAMDYTPNIDALRWFFGEIYELLIRRVPTLQVLIVGRSPDAEILEYAKLPNVVVTGSVVDVRPFYRRAWLQIVPLRIGCGTRLKILESLAMGTPVVSTVIGAQGLGLEHEQHALLADSAAGFADQVARALCNPDMRSRLAFNGRNLVKAQFGWQSIGDRLNEIYQRVAAKPLAVW